MLTIYIGNKLKNLAKTLSQNIHSSISPLKKATVCVQTSGMQRWAALTLAETAGVSANLDFIFPAALIKRFAELHTGKKDLWTEKDTLVWLVFRQLAHLAPRPAFSMISEYLKDDTDQIKTFRLALRIADIFDQYQLYRPEMVLSWLDGIKGLTGDELWQAELFRSVFPDKNRCKTIVLQNLINDLKAGKTANMPDTVHMFGLSVIPPFFIDVLNAASAGTDIFMYLLSPTEHYFGDSKSDREISRLEKRTGKSADEQGIRQNHPLLDNLGTIGRDFFDNLIEKTNFNNISDFSPIEPKTLLNAVQYEILELDEIKDFIPADNDRSVTVAGCHNPLREAEELYDYLLSLFDSDSTLKPSDILVMTPDIRSMAPYIRSVFDNPYSPETAIPYTLADIPQRTDNAPAGIFMELVDTITGQFSLSSAMRLLDNEILASHFGIKDTDFIAEMLDKNGGYWGLTGQELIDDGVVTDIRFTFDRAMRRLALGLAEGNSGAVYAEAAGSDVPFSKAEEIGGLMRFIELCAEYRKTLKTQQTPDSWCQIMMDMADAFLSDSQEYSDDTVSLIKNLSKIRESSSCMTEPISFRPVYETLQSSLDEVRGAKGFMNGRVTFCAMLPMRSIPFRVICILGLNDSTFPRIKTSLEFDLIARHQRKGDRTQRDSDKYLFLETIISAQEKLYLSYKSRSETDNRSLVPSILITELTRYLETKLNAGKILTEHRLHSFSRLYFTGDKKLFTYSPQRFSAAEAIAKKSQDVPFCPVPLSPEISTEITLGDFESFFINPPKFFLEKTLGVRTVGYENMLPETEKMNMNTLDRYNLRTMSLETAMNSGNPDKLLTYARMTAQIPSGGIGDACEKDIMDYTEKSYNIIKDYAHDGQNVKDISVSCAGLTISGRISNFSGDKWLYVKSGKIKAKDFIRVLVRHAVLNCGEEAVESHILSDGGITILEPFDTKKLITTMAEFFKNGLKQPFCFHPADCVEMLKTSQRGLKFIAKDNYSSAETDPAFALCFNMGIDAGELIKNADVILSEAAQCIRGAGNE